MDIEKVLNELDGLFATNKLDEVEPLLKEKYDEALSIDDLGAALSILNELIGYYREMTMKEQTRETVELIMETLGKAGLKGSLAEGTSLMNIANAYRFLGEYEASLSCYKRVEEIYEAQLADDDFRWPSLYNNTSLLHSTIGRHEQAIEYLKKALELAKKHEDADIEIAVTYTNIGQAYTKLGQYGEAEENLKTAEEIFAKTDKKNYHYSGCANAFGALYYVQGDYEQACRYYEEALVNMHDTVGRTANYRLVYNDLMKAYEKAGKPVYEDMMSLCEGYYETYGELMIEEKFPEYAGKIAVGLCGEGSECYGFDDDISLDHDCGPGFAMYVTDETYKEIGRALSEEYAKLPRIFAGHIRQEMDYAKGRVGVNTIDGFFDRVLGGRKIPKTEKEWSEMPEYALACAVNGKVFTDEEGVFTEKRRRLLEYYPENVWRKKLAQELINMAQTGQYNYGRMMARGEYVTVQVILGQYMQHLMNTVFLINKTYAPYYKWTHRAMKKLQVLPELAYVMEAISDMPSQRDVWKDAEYKTTPNENDMIAMTMEIVAKIITDKLNELGLSKSSDTYLEAQGREVLNNI